MSCRFKSCEMIFATTSLGSMVLRRRKKGKIFWGELDAIRGLWGGPWCMVDYFNVVKFLIESSRGGILTY